VHVFDQLAPSCRELENILSIIGDIVIVGGVHGILMPELVQPRTLVLLQSTLVAVPQNSAGVLLSLGMALAMMCGKH
jgi:hypothetical protein